MPEPTRDLNCTCFRLRRTTRRVTQLYDGALKPLGLTITQMNVLAMIGASGTRPATVLAEALGMDDSTLSRTVRPLVERGLLRHASGRDRRVRMLGLTPAGERAIEAALPLWRSAQREVERALGSDLRILHDLLARLGPRPD